MKKFLLSLLLFFLGINICYATQTYDRNELDNYGVNKDIKINSSNLNDILKTKAVDASLKVYDFAELLDNSEEDDLSKLALKFYEDTGFDLVIVTDSFYNYDDEDNYAYAQNFYDYNDFGIDDKYYSGVLVLRNNYSSYPFYTIRTYGEAQLYFAGERTEKMLDKTSSLIADDEYYSAFSDVITCLNDYYDDGISSEYKNYKINENGDLVAPYKFPLLIALLVAGCFTFFYISYYVSKNKMIYKAKLAHDYLDEGSVVYSVKENKFLHTRTRAIPKSNGSSGSSGGGFRGSSGRSSSGGGRRV